MNELLELTNSKKGVVAPGGFCEVLAVPQEDVEFFPILDPITQTINDNILLQKTKFFLAFTLSFTGRAFKEEMQSSKAGSFFLQTISGKCFDQGKTNHILFSNMTHHRWVLIVRERKTGITYVIGKPGSACSFFVNYVSQEGTITDVSWINQAKYKAILYTGTVFQIPPGIINDKPLLTMLLEFRVGDPGMPAANQSSFTFAALIGKSKLAVYVDGSLLSDKGFGDVLAYTYTPSLGKIDTTIPLNEKSIVQIYEVTV